jgi:15-cis-phytoene synthase
MPPPREPVRPIPNPGDWERCKAIARHHGRSFFFASRCLPPARRRAALATYAYCRIADDIVDQVREAGPEASDAALARWEAQLTRPVDPVAIAFAHTRDRFSIPEQPVRDLLTGLRMDLTTTRYATWDELRTYCYHVAGTVGLMVAPIFGCRDPLALSHAAQLGIAMQLTNILRDVAEDARLGRLYLPLDEIAAFGCDPDALLDGQPGEGFPALIAFQVDRARALYADALRGVRALAPSGRITTLAASNLYAGILTEIEALDYDVFRARAQMSSARKLRTMPGVAATFLRITLFPNGSAAHTAQEAPPGVPQALPDASSSRNGYESYG